MKIYRTTRAISLNSGKIKLNAKQAAARQHLLIDTGTDGVYLPKETICFKVGEVIGLEVVSKAMAACLELGNVVDGVFSPYGDDPESADPEKQKIASKKQAILDRDKPKV